ncbi:class I SAM-dependent methyltransferase [Candidatus Nomurabacteria bacterium]|nr:class I SAM-dependent methyltransferase [Candidatus Nomurabacteria bacterium]
MFANPLKILKQFGVADDMIVVDLGAGSGFYSIPLAQMVSNGKVYSVEIQKDFLKTIKNKADESGLHNIDFIWGDVEKKEGTKLKKEIVDRVLASNILFQINDKHKFADEIGRILKKGGKLLLIDWLEDKKIFNSKDNKHFEKREAVAFFGEKGFILEREIDVGGHHYGIILIKK